MAAFGSVSTASVENDVNVTVTKPTGLAAGDLMVAFCFNTGGTSRSFNTPTNWAEILATNGTSVGVRLHIFAKVADASDAAAAEFIFTNITADFTKSVVLYRITGTFASSVNVTASSAGGGAEQTDDDPRFATGIVPTGANSLLIMWAGGYVTNSSTSTLSGYAIQTSDPAWTERADFAVASDEDQRVGSATATRAETSDTGYFQVDFNSTDNVGQNVMALISIQDTTNVTVNATPLILTATLTDQDVTGDANTTLTPLVVTATLPDPTYTEEDGKWSNQSKNSSIWTNQDKS